MGGERRIHNLRCRHMTSSTQSVFLEAALRYAALGLRVIPLRPREKVPILSDWPAKATTDNETITKWWQQNPDANVGLVCGELLVVLDVDGAPGWDSLEGVGVKAEQLPVTWIAETGREGGRHLFFRSQPGLRSRVRLLDGVDIKGAGGYVVAAPSVHPNGNHYKWQAGRAPWDVDLAELPEDLLQQLEKGDHRSNGDDGDDAPIPEGERNDTLFRLGCSLRNRGLTANEIEDVLLGVNKRRCQPPLEKEEVRSIADSCARYAPGDQVEGHGVGGRSSKAMRLVQLASSGVLELFRDQEGECYATIAVGSHRETLHLESKAFKDWLGYIFFQAERGVLNTNTLTDTVAQLAARARYESGITRPVYQRVAEANHNIYIDLGGEDWRTVKITPEGWSLIEYADCPVRFRRSTKTGQLPEPERGGSISELRQPINVTDSEWALLLGWILQALRGQGNYPLLLLRGGQGDGKTTLARLLKRLIDPDTLEVRLAPRDIRDLITAARNGHILAFDNLSRITAELSDALCCLSTGGGFGGRALYTDYDEAAFAARRPIILTSITEVVGRSDLLDRSLIITMVPLADQHPGDDERPRESEEIFWSKFEMIKPRILGALYDALAAGLRDSGSVKLEETTRMADFAVWACAGLPVLGVTAQEFLTAYKQNRAGANETALEASLIAEYVKALATREGGWEDTATKLLDQIRNMAGDDGQKQPGFPNTPKGYTRGVGAR